MMIAGSNAAPTLDDTATLGNEVTLTVNVSQANSGTAGGTNAAFSGAATALLAAAGQPGNVGRALTGLSAPSVSGKGAAKGAAETAAGDDGAPLVVELGQSAADAAKDAVASAERTLPGAVTQQAANALQGVAGNQGGTNKLTGSAATAGVSKVASAQVLAPVTGEVLYQWQAGTTTDGSADRQGTDTVTATPAAHKQLAELVQAAGATVTPTVGGTGGAMAVAGADTPLAQFADKLATAMRSNVTEQATVQLQGLSQGLQDGTVGGAAGTSGNADAGATGGQVRMLLNPPELGEIRIDLTVKDGSVHGTIAASDGAVVSLLAQQVHVLKHGLDQAGLKLGEQGINLMLSNSNQQGNSQGNPNAQQQAGQAGNGGAWRFWHGTGIG